MTAPTVRHRDVGDKYATGVPKIKKIRGRENMAVGTWNVRTLRPAGKDHTKLVYTKDISRSQVNSHFSCRWSSGEH